MDADEVYARLVDAVCDDGDAAGIAIEASYQPAMTGGKVAPPTFPREQSEGKGSRYATERRLIDGTVRDVVTVDTVPSQANRVEARLDAVAAEAGLPVVEIVEEFGAERARVTSWTAPHRHADAYFEHAELDGKPYWQTPEGAELMAARPDAAGALLRWFPGALVFGSWTSRKKGRQARFPRVYTSEMIGLDYVEGERLGVRADPLNLQKGPSTLTKKKLADIGLGMIPAGGSLGGVTVSEVRRLAWLSFGGLRLLGFGGGEADTAARAQLAALALWGDRLAFAGSSVWLRSGCDLLREREAMAWVVSGTRREAVEVSAQAARGALEIARARADEVGVGMAREVRSLSASRGLREAMEFTLISADGDGE